MKIVSSLCLASVTFAVSTLAATRVPEPVVPEGGMPPGPFPNKTVTGANWVMITPLGTDYGNGALIMNLEEQGPIPWAITRYNRGDPAIRLSPRDPLAAKSNLGVFQEYARAEANEAPGQCWRPSPEVGLILPTVRKNGQTWEDNTEPFWGTTAIGNTSSGTGYSMDDGAFGTGNYEVQTGRAGSRTEANINFATAWFPYHEGWLAGFIAEAGPAGEAQWRTPGSHSGGLGSPNVVTWKDLGGGFGGVATLALPRVHAIEDGMLFVVSAKGDSNVKIAAAAPIADGSGWVITIREDAEVDPNVLVGAGSDFAFLHVPYGAENLIGGYVDGENGKAIKSKGGFTLQRLAAGRSSLSTPGKTGKDGMLILGNADFLAGSTTLADNNFLSYEFDTASAAFIIEARHTMAGDTTALEDTDFVFAWIDFVSPLHSRPILHPGPEPVVPSEVAGSQGPGPFPNTSLTGANWVMATPPGTDYGSSQLIMNLQEQGPIPWAITRYNRGDPAIRLSPRDPVNAKSNLGVFQEYARAEANEAPGQCWRPSPDVGLILPTVRRNGQTWQDNTEPFWGTTAIGNTSSGTGYSMGDGTFGTGNYEAQTGRAGSRTESNIDFATAWFPYDQGWTAGFIGDVGPAGESSWRTPNSHSQDLGDPGIVKWSDAGGAFGGPATLSLPRVHSINDGMLFTVSAKGDSNVKISSAAPQADGSGWLITLREDAEVDPTVLVSAGSDFAFVFIPYDAVNLVGGYINGEDASKIKSAGNFTVARTAAGRYEITIPGKTKADGMLILGNADFQAANPTLADNNFLSYEFDAASGKFIVEARHTSAGDLADLEDTAFNFAWVDFKQPMSRFALSSAAAPPTLSVARTGDNLMLSWPAANGAFVLEDSSRLSPGTWAPAPEPVITAGGRNEVTVSIGAGPRFFRLRQ